MKTEILVKKYATMRALDLIYDKYVNVSRTFLGLCLWVPEVILYSILVFTSLGTNTKIPNFEHYEH